MLKWLPIIGPLLCEYGQAQAADCAAEEIRGAIRRIVFWIVVLVVTAVVAIAVDVPAIGEAVLRAVVVCYTIEGVIKGIAGVSKIREQFRSWPARVCGITLATVVRAGGLPLISLLLLYAAMWNVRRAMGEALGFSFWGWIWSSLMVW